MIKKLKAIVKIVTIKNIHFLAYNLFLEKMLNSCSLYLFTKYNLINYIYTVKSSKMYEIKVIF